MEPHYFRTLFRRENRLKQGLLGFFYSLSSWPKLLLEVFLRRNFGERYFKLSSAFSVVIFFGLLPVIIRSYFAMFSRQLGGYYEPEPFWPEYVLYYAFLGVFLFFAFKRRKEIKKSKSVFYSDRFSLSAGDIQYRFWTKRFLGLDPNPRNIEIFFEPAVFFFPGVLLWIVGQNLGILLVICSLFYCFSYARQYEMGDDFMLDKIDQAIANRELENALLRDDWNPKSGLQFRHRRPSSEEMRSLLAREILPPRKDFPEAT